MSHFERHRVTSHRRMALVPSVQPAPCSVPGTLAEYARLLVGAAGEAPGGLTTKTTRGDLVRGAGPAPVYISLQTLAITVLSLQKRRSSQAPPAFRAAEVMGSPYVLLAACPLPEARFNLLQRRPPGPAGVQHSTSALQQVPLKSRHREANSLQDLCCFSSLCPSSCASLQLHTPNTQMCNDIFKSYPDLLGYAKEILSTHCLGQARPCVFFMCTDAKNTKRQNFKALPVWMELLFHPKMKCSLGGRLASLSIIKQLGTC